jgi:hypothetical protein
MVKLFTTILFLSFFILACTSNDSRVKTELTKNSSDVTKVKDSGTVSTASYFRIENDSITVLPFEIAVSLSPKAKEKIISNKETIIVNVSLSGSPKDEELVSEDGNFYVASSEKEIIYGQLAKFDKIKFSKETYDQLIDKDVYVNVFFYSGRKSAKDNLLSGDILSDKISNVVLKQFELTGKLIYGED